MSGKRQNYLSYQNKQKDLIYDYNLKYKNGKFKPKHDEDYDDDEYSNKQLWKDFNLIKFDANEEDFKNCDNEENQKMKKEINSVAEEKQGFADFYYKGQRSEFHQKQIKIQKSWKINPKMYLINQEDENDREEVENYELRQYNKSDEDDDYDDYYHEYAE